MRRCTKPIDQIGQIDSDKVFYTGEYLPNIGVNTNQTLTQILEILNDNPSGGNGTTQGDNFTAIGDGLQKVFLIPHNLGGIPTAVSVQALNEESQGFTTNYNLTNITITYTIAPSLGDNISLSWIAIKL